MLRWDDRWVLVQTSTGFLSLASPKVSDILWQGNTCVTCASLTKSLWSIKYTLWLPRQGPEWTHNRAHMGLLSCSWLVGSKCLQQVCSFLFCFVFVCFVLFLKQWLTCDETKRGDWGWDFPGHSSWESQAEGYCLLSCLCVDYALHSGNIAVQQLSSWDYDYTFIV